MRALVMDSLWMNPNRPLPSASGVDLNKWLLEEFSTAGVAYGRVSLA